MSAISFLLTQQVAFISHFRDSEKYAQSIWEVYAHPNFPGSSEAPEPLVLSSWGLEEAEPDGWEGVTVPASQGWWEDET